MEATFRLVLSVHQTIPIITEIVSLTAPPISLQFQISKSVKVNNSILYKNELFLFFENSLQLAVCPIKNSKNRFIGRI